MSSPASPPSFIALVSGGKDSLYSILEAQRRGLVLACLANLYPPPPAAEGGNPSQELDSFMFQTVGHPALPCIAAALRVLT